MSIIWLCI